MARNPIPRLPETVRKQAIEGSTLGAGVLLVAALLLIANYFGWKYFHRFDWTSSRLYTLSEKSANLVRDLDKDVEVVLFMRPTETIYEPVRELLARYEAASPRLKVRAVDPDRNLVEAQRLVDQGVGSLNVVVFDTGEDRRVIESADLAEYDYSGMQFGEGPRMTSFKAEQRFTGAILELVESRKPKLLFTTGHGETPLNDPAGASGGGLSQAQQLLGRDNFTIEEFASLGKSEVPAGTDLLVVAAPKQPFLAPELDLLSRYLDGGGRQLVLLDPAIGPVGARPPTGLEAWLGRYGIEVGSDVVVDPANPLPFFGAETIFASSYGAHPTTKALSEARVPVVLALARSVGRSASAPADLDVVQLLETSGEGWGERDLVNLRAVQKDPSDLPGPVSLAVAVAKRDPAAAEGNPDDMPDLDAAPPEGASQTAAVAGADAEAQQPAFRLAVFGDGDWVTDSQLGSAGNATLLADTMNWLVERQQLLGIAAKAPEQVRLNLTGGELRGIFWLVLVLMPAMAIAAGVVVQVRRRR